MRWYVLALIAGCAGNTDGPEVVIDNMVTLDVVVAPSGVTIYPEGRSMDSSCESWFPSIGGVARIGDVLRRCESFACVEHVTYAGSTYAVPMFHEPLVIASPPSGPTLVLEGCGATATIELPLVTLPSAPTVHGDVVYDATNRIVDVDWESDPRAATHLVTLGSSLWLEVHHVEGEMDRFTTPYGGWLSTRVQSLLPGGEHLTALGLVRVWPASEATSYRLEVAPRL
jgi:hypothetical protein